MKHFRLDHVLKIHDTSTWKCQQVWLVWPFRALPGWLQLMSLGGFSAALGVSAAALSVLNAG